MPSTTRPDFGRLGGYTLEHLKDTPVLGKHHGVIRWMGDHVGLGGYKERFTRGELAWWMVSAWMLGISTGGFISWLVAS